MVQCSAGAAVLVLAGAATAWGQTAALPATADTYLKSGSPNQSQGGESILRIQSSGSNRSLVGFGPSAIAEAVGSGSLVSARLELFIASNAGNWGPDGGTVDAHRLTVAWTEPGATWNCPADTNPADGSPDCAGQWNGGSFEEEPSDTVLHTNSLGGWIGFDVTADVAALLAGGDLHGWLIKKTEEGQNGRVDYASREAGGGTEPRLVLVVESAEHDETPPRLAITSPSEPVLINEPSPAIAVEYSDGGSGIEIGTLSVSLDGVDVTAACSPGPAMAVCLPGSLSPGPHSIEASISDQAGNLATASLGFELLAGPGLHTLRLPITADTYVRQGAPNQNQGGESVLRLRQSGKNRSLLRLDAAEVASLLAGTTVHSARLELFIADDGNNWGASGRTVDLHPVTVPWSELGATWNCADDVDPANQQPDCSPQWAGGTFDPTPTGSLLVTNGLSGRVGFDVTAEVAALAAGAPHDGWLLKKTAEGQSGLIDFVSREGGTEGPAVVVVFESVGSGDDPTPPSAAILAPRDGAFVPDATPEIRMSFADSESGIEPTSLLLRVDAVDRTAELIQTAAGARLPASEPLEDGVHEVEFEVRDRAGNTTRLETSFITDTVPPDLAFISPAGGSLPAGDLSPPIEISYVDLTSGVEPDTLAVTIDGRVINSSCEFTPDLGECASPVLTTGSHTIAARAVDRAGNPVEVAIAIELEGDAAPPEVTITTPSAGVLVNTPVAVVAGQTVDETAVAAVWINGIDAALTGESFSGSATLFEGLNRVLVVVEDTSANEGFATVDIVLDSTAPEVSIESPRPDQVVNASAIRVAGLAWDDNGVGEVTLNGQPVSLDGRQFEGTVSLDPGDNLIRARAVDAVGNVREQTFQVLRFVLPEVIITAPAELTTTGASTVDVTGTVSDSSATVSVNGEPATVAGGTFMASGVPLIEGGNVVTAVAMSPDGHIGTDSVLVTRDATPPRPVVLHPAAGAVLFESTVHVTGLVNDIVAGTVNTSEVKVTVNGVAAEVSHRSFAVSALPLVLGENTITVTAVDEVGNIGQTSVTVDRVQPHTPRIAIVSGNLQQGTIGTEVGEPLVVTLLDVAGAPVSGSLVLFEVRGNDGHLGTGRRQVAVPTDASGQAEVRFTLGSHAGVLAQRVEASAVGFAGPAVFHATALPGEPFEIVVDAGDQQVGIAGLELPRPLIATVVDAGGNRLAGVPVDLAVVLGQGRFENDLQQLSAVTDTDGRVVVQFRLDPEEGIAANVVEAVIAGTSEPFASFVATGLVAGEPGATSLSGIVLDNQNEPIEGVTMRIRDTGITAETDQQGRFEIPGAPVGSVYLIADGSTADRPGSWPDLEYLVTTIPGRDNDVGMPIFLLPLNLSNGIQVDETHGGVLTLPDVPGFALEVAPGSVIFPGGSRSGVVSVTTVHSDKVPMVPNFGQQPRLIVTIQPAGARFDPPARMTLPNVEGLSPGEVTELYSFDHDLGHFVSIGPGTVSDDGMTIVSNPGVGVVEAGWHCGGDPSSSGTAHACPECQQCVRNRCVADDGKACDDNDDCTVRDECQGGACGGDERKINSVEATANGAPSAQIYLQESVTLAAEVDADDCDSLTYRWNFGDGSPLANSETVVHTYDEPGSYAALVEVKCGSCDTEIAHTSVTVRCPDVRITGTEPPVSVLCPGCEMEFFAEVEPAGFAINYVFAPGGDLGGKATLSAGGLLQIAEDAPKGEVIVRATVTDDGRECFDARSIFVFVPDDVPKDSDDRTPNENDWIRNHPWCAFKNRHLGSGCDDQLLRWFGPACRRDPTVGNAFLHAYCNCITARSCGVDIAKELWDAHEEHDENTCQNASMDFHNNEIGRQASAGSGSCEARVFDALRDGRLRWLDPPPAGPQECSEYEAEFDPEDPCITSPPVGGES